MNSSTISPENNNLLVNAFLWKLNSYTLDIDTKSTIAKLAVECLEFLDNPNLFNQRLENFKMLPINKTSISEIEKIIRAGNEFFCFSAASQHAKCEQKSDSGLIPINFSKSFEGILENPKVLLKLLHTFPNYPNAAITKLTYYITKSGKFNWPILYGNQYSKDLLEVMKHVSLSSDIESILLVYEIGRIFLKHSKDIHFCNEIQDLLIHLFNEKPEVIQALIKEFAENGIETPWRSNELLIKLRGLLKNDHLFSIFVENNGIKNLILSINNFSDEIAANFDHFELIYTSELIHDPIIKWTNSYLSANELLIQLVDPSELKLFSHYLNEHATELATKFTHYKEIISSNRKINRLFVDNSVQLQKGGVKNLIFHMIQLSKSDNEEMRRAFNYYFLSIRFDPYRLLEEFSRYIFSPILKEVDTTADYFLNTGKRSLDDACYIISTLLNVLSTLSPSNPDNTSTYYELAVCHILNIINTLCLKHPRIMGILIVTNEFKPIEKILSDGVESEQILEKAQLICSNIVAHCLEEGYHSILDYIEHPILKITMNRLLKQLTEEDKCLDSINTLNKLFNLDKTPFITTEFIKFGGFNLLENLIVSKNEEIFRETNNLIRLTLHKNLTVHKKTDFSIIETNIRKYLDQMLAGKEVLTCIRVLRTFILFDEENKCTTEFLEKGGYNFLANLLMNSPNDEFFLEVAGLFNRLDAQIDDYTSNKVMDFLLNKFNHGNSDLIKDCALLSLVNFCFIDQTFKCLHKFVKATGGLSYWNQILITTPHSQKSNHIKILINLIQQLPTQDFHGFSLDDHIH